MTGFGKVSPGDPTDLIKSARYHNAIIDLLSDHGQLEASTPFLDPFDSQSAVVRVKNTDSAEVPRGGVLGVGAVVVDADDNEGHFLDTDPCFVGVAPDIAIHRARFVVALGPIASGKIGPAVASGWVPAKVDIKDTSHTAADLVDGDIDKLVSAAGAAIPLVVSQAGTGEKWALVKVPSTSPTVCCALAKTATTAEKMTSASSEVTWGDSAVGKAWLYDAPTHAASTWTASQCGTTDADRIDIVSAHHDTDLVVGMWVLVFSTTPIVCGGGPYLAKYLNADDFLRQRTGFDESKDQALYHEAGSTDLKWGGNECT